MFPSFVFPDDLAEEDEMWQPETVRCRETSEELHTRARTALQECLEIGKGATGQFRL